MVPCDRLCEIFHSSLLLETFWRSQTSTMEFVGAVNSDHRLDISYGESMFLILQERSNITYRSS